MEEEKKEQEPLRAVGPTGPDPETITINLQPDDMTIAPKWNFKINTEE